MKTVSRKLALQSKQILVDENVDEGWEQIRDVISNVANKILGTTKQKSKPWFNVICEALQRRKVARQK